MVVGDPAGGLELVEVARAIFDAWVAQIRASLLVDLDDESLAIGWGDFDSFWSYRFVKRFELFDCLVVAQVAVA